MAVTESVEQGIIPESEADDIFICVGVFIHWDAKDNQKIQDWNYQATKESIERAVKRIPKARDVIAKKGTAHPFAAHE
jgi:5,6,7,8-tetrahydromethanopterin hydro-lyase